MARAGKYAGLACDPIAADVAYDIEVVPDFSYTDTKRNIHQVTFVSWRFSITPVKQHFGNQHGSKNYKNPGSGRRRCDRGGASRWANEHA